MSDKKSIHTSSKPLKSRIKFLLAALLCAVLMLLLLIVPGPAINGARTGLTLCGDTVIPSLFPFLVLSAFIIKSGIADRLGRFFEPMTRKIFRLPGSTATALILGAVGGYPVGANAVAQLHKSGSLSKKDGERLLCFCINSSPAFIIGAVGAGFLGSVKAGILLYIVHLSASFAVGLVSNVAAKKHKNLPEPKHEHNEHENLSSAFVSSVTNSVRGTLSIAAYVVLFSSLTSLLNYTGFTAFISNFISSVLPVPGSDSLFYSRAVTGIFEVTNGCAAAAGSYGMPALILTAVVLGWSGLSVQCQVMSMVKESGLSTQPFIITRLLHMLFSALFAWILFSIFPSAIPAFAPAVQVFAYNPDNITMAVHPAPAVSAMLIICAMLLLSLVQI